MFSNMVKSAGTKPQIITIHGKESAVVISYEAYKKLTAPRESLVSFMENSPWASLELDLPVRSKTETRNIDL